MKNAIFHAKKEGEIPSFKTGSWDEKILNSFIKLESKKKKTDSKIMKLFFSFLQFMTLRLAL